MLAEFIGDESNLSSVHVVFFRPGTFTNEASSLTVFLQLMIFVVVTEQPLDWNHHSLHL
jgi:hypothetical protein